VSSFLAGVEMIVLAVSFLAQWCRDLTLQANNPLEFDRLVPNLLSPEPSTQIQGVRTKSSISMLMANMDVWKRGIDKELRKRKKFEDWGRRSNMCGRGKWIGLGRKFLGGGIVGSGRFICGNCSSSSTSSRNNRSWYGMESELGVFSALMSLPTWSLRGMAFYMGQMQM
jgi:hypothetical protein